jgi:hypothetical protein
MVMHMTPELTLADLTRRTGLDVLDHVERQVAIPVSRRAQAQGDLIVIPYDYVTADVRMWDYQELAWHRSGLAWPWREVTGAGIELLRSAGGGHPHTLVADPGACRWTTYVQDLSGLALGALAVTGTAYLIHPEHGGTGIGPGRYVVRRQREYGHSASARAIRLVAD